MLRFRVECTPMALLTHSMCLYRIDNEFWKSAVADFIYKNCDANMRMHANDTNEY